MKKTPNEIIAQIRALLDELDGATNRSVSTKVNVTKTVARSTAGCIGAIQGLIDEGFFETQKMVSQVVDKLREEGQPYSRALVSMNLLNLVKPPRKTLRRINENKQWHYIIRR